MFSPFYLYEGSFTETFWYFKDIVVSLCIYLGIFIYFIFNLNNYFKGSTMTSDETISHGVVVGSIISATYLYLSGIIPFNLNADSFENAHLYDVFFDFRFYIIDAILFIMFVFILKKYSWLKTIGYIVLFKALTLLALYLNLVSAVHNAYDPIWKSESNALSSFNFCRNKYIHTDSYVLIKFSDCPYKTLSERDLYIKMAEYGSYIALQHVNNDENIALSEKASVNKNYYLNNQYLEKTSWLENNMPSLYKKTSLAINKKVYAINKTRNLKLVDTMLNDDQQYLQPLKTKSAPDKKFN